MASLPELKVTVFSDYICPFCYIGYHRLMRLQDSYNLKINWCFLEIHPETDAQGEPVSSMDYPSETWQSMMTELNRVAKEEDIKLNEIHFISNSRNALLLSEAAKQAGRECFYLLHEKLFNAFFVDNLNIADKKLLQQLAEQCGINPDIIHAAWSSPEYATRLQNNFHEARKHDIQSVPSFIFGDKKLTGVVKEQAFRKAAERLHKHNQDIATQDIAT